MGRLLLFLIMTPQSVRASIKHFSCWVHHIHTNPVRAGWQSAASTRSPARAQLDTQPAGADCHAACNRATPVAITALAVLLKGLRYGTTSGHPHHALADTGVAATRTDWAPWRLHKICKYTDGS